jgi:asparagine synthase (glutamine-hydrolysing)
VHPVLPGSIFVFDRNGNHLRQEHLPKLRLSIRYFSEEEASQKVREALYSAIRCRVNDQRNIGVALSGGIDSIGLVSTLRHLYPEAEIHTFTTGDSENDLINASETAQKMNTMHHEILIHPDFLKDSLADLVWCLEEPCGRTETLLLREVGRVASKFVQVMFASAGPDSLFGGMPRYKLLWLMKKAPILKRPLGEFYDLTQVGIKPKSLLGRALDTLYFRGKLPNAPKVIGASYFAKPSEFGQINQEFINTNLVKRFQYGICSGMHKYEKNFAAFGMSYRSPFFDRNLIQVAYSIPDSLKIRNGRDKYILRRALKSIVPDELLNVPKSLQRMKYDVDFSNTLDEISDKFLSRENVIRRGFFDYSDIERLRKRKTDKPYSGEGAMRLWTALLTETWAQEFLDKRGAGPRSSPESQ